MIWIYFAIIIEIEEKKKGGKEEEKYSTGVSASAKKIYSRNYAFSLIYVVVTRSLFQLSNFQRSIFLAVNDPYYRTIRNKTIVFQNYSDLIWYESRINLIKSTLNRFPDISKSMIILLTSNDHRVKILTTRTMMLTTL